MKVSSRDIDNLGELVINFTQDMRLVKDLSLIDKDVLSLEVLPDDSNISDKLDAFDLEWTVTEQKERFMKLKIEWKYAFQISAGM